ncbi:MAG TPA: hypothetical protein PLB81_06645 [Deltaproteobacteria bacterium]|nr:hypothetical protein [Deltaproteobacteria bacterium]
MRYAHTKVFTVDSASSPGRPRRIELGGVMVDVEEVIDHWVSAAKDPSFYPNEYYKVKVAGGRVFILMYNTLFNSWWIKGHIT